MSQLTVFLARFMGLFTVLVVAALLVRGSAIIDATVADRQVMFVWALVSLAIGIAITLGHNVWSGGALPVVVTLVGWLILIKGLVLLFVPSETLSFGFQSMHYGEHMVVYVAPALVLGLYLSWGGFAARGARTF
jgi:hypothetical protein